MPSQDRAGLYIHIPFCSSKCNYCDFNSYEGKLSLAGNYFEAMAAEIEIYREQLGMKSIDTIFIGGGTPSCVEASFIHGALNEARKCFTISENCEITIESNPGTLSGEKLNTYRASGINRISIGLQAYQEPLLRFLGRRHSADDFAESIKAAKKAGFNNINGDVIFGIPGQTLGDWKETLEALIALEVNHISAYSLKIEEGTKFGAMLQSGKLIPVEDELDREMYHYAIEYLEKNGYQHYELSNFAQPGFQCRHNLIYWKCVDYLGVGAGAHSYLNDIRFSNEYAIEKYIELLQQGKKPVQESNIIAYEDRMSEFMFLGLRLKDGVRGSEFENLFHQNLFEKYATSLRKLQHLGLIYVVEDCVRLTNLGLDLANQVFMEFV